MSARIWNYWTRSGSQAVLPTSGTVPSQPDLAGCRRPIAAPGLATATMTNPAPPRLSSTCSAAARADSFTAHAALLKKKKRVFNSESGNRHLGYRGVPRVACRGGASRASSSPGHRVRSMVLTRRGVLPLAADQFEDMELLYPLCRLREEDVAVTVAGLDHQPVSGKKGHGPVPVDCPVGQVTGMILTRWSSPAVTHRTSCGARRPCLPWPELSMTRASRLPRPNSRSCRR